MPFQSLLRRLREDELKLTQPAFARKLGISVRTLSHWECAHWLPDYKQRVHFILRLSDVPPEYVLALADALGVSVDPVVARFLQPFRDALEEEDDDDDVPDDAPPEAPPPPAAPPPPPRPTAEQVRAAVDPIVLAAADALDARPNDLRALVAQVVAACAAVHATIEDVGESVKPRAKTKAAPST